MNVLITTRCNKGCSFCFAHTHNKSRQEDMSLENFKQLLDFFQRSQPSPSLKLLGGEPTLHPAFALFVEELISRKIPFSLISNGLYTNPAVQESLRRSIEKNLLQSVLLNAAELYQHEKQEVFKKNYHFLQAAFQQEINRVICGITLSRQKSVAEEVTYVKELHALMHLHFLRFSIDFLGENTEDTFLLGNTTYGDKITSLLKFCQQEDIVLSGDCVVYPCMFKDPLFVKYKLPGLIPKYSTCCDVNTMPFDINPDLSFFHCYPAHIFAGGKITDFPSFHHAYRYMQIKKLGLEAVATPPQTCQNCQFFKDKGCNGLCLGCKKLEDQALCAPCK